MNIKIAFLSLNIVILAQIVCACSDGGKQYRNIIHENAPMTLYGATETDSPEAVGALLYSDSYSSFCTATLIRPEWVLTAAHCLENRKPSELLFTLSSDVRHLDSPVYEVRRLLIHPDYRTTTYINDIALVELTSPIEDVEVPELQRELLERAFTETSPHFVGYGYDEDRLSGIKRTAAIPVLSLGIATFTTYYKSSLETGACFGDSGGPVFDTLDGDGLLLGVVSNILSDGDNDPCIGSYNVTRVDKYANWILAGVDETSGLQQCTEDRAICFCDDACTGDGTCDNSLCAVMDCEQSYDCILSCDVADGACMNDCHIQTAVPELATFELFLDCGNDSCGQTTEEELLNCLINDCHDSFHSCFGATDCAITGGDCVDETTCREGRYTLTSCWPSDSKPLGASCNPTDNDMYPCADGLYCARIDNESVCAQLCFSDDDCEDNQECMDISVGEFREQPYSVCTQNKPRAKSQGCGYYGDSYRNRMSILTVLLM